MFLTKPSINSQFDLHNLFSDQVNKDNLQFKINSIHLPNPIYTLSPKYCLVAMEPLLSGKTPELFQSWINKSFKNFLYSHGDFILHYCAYTFLCHESFDYHITDISKGAMNTTLANKQRKDRYSNWLNILNYEFEFFGNPLLIGVGRTATEFLSKAGFQTEFSVMHYSQNNCARFNNYYQNHPKQYPTHNLHIKLKNFAMQLLEKADYKKEMRDFTLNKIFNKELSNWEKGMFLNYMDKFSSTAN